MNEFNNFKKYMSKLGAVYTPKKDNICANFQLGKYLNFQIQSTEDQHETGLIAVHICLRKGGFYFPLGDSWAIGALKLIEKIEEILLDYNINYSLVLKACW